MTYYAHISSGCKLDAQKHGLYADIDRLAKQIEATQAIDHLSEHGRILKKGLGRSYRLLMGKVYDGDDCMIVFLCIFPRSSRDYELFWESPDSVENKLDELCSDGTLAAVWAAKRESPEIPPLSSLSSQELAYLYTSGYEDAEDWLVLESNEWVKRVDRIAGSFSSYVASIQPLIIEILDHYLDDTMIDDGKVAILYRCLPSEKVLYLAAPAKPDDKNDVQALQEQFRRELKGTVDEEWLLRKSRRAYPGLVLYDTDLWIHRVEEASEKANLALSKEEANILHLRGERYPLFINGRPGSGKSTILQYLFAEHLRQYIVAADTHLGLPLYLTYNKELLDLAKDNVLSLLTSNANSNLVGKDVLDGDEDLKRLEKSFVDFREFLTLLLPPEQRFEESKYIGFPEFRLLFNKKFSKHPVKQVRDVTAELAWHVIRTYIKGAAAELDVDLDTDGYFEWPTDQKSVTDSTYETVYKRVWLEWYKRLCEEDGWWDDQDLARRLLLLAAEDPENIDLARHPAIFCDEAQDFTRNELRLIYRLSLFSRRSLTPDVLKLIPFAFAGDPFQTLNPTGFNWESTYTVFYQTIVEQLDKRQKRLLELNYQELAFNYRSTRAIVQLCNFIHLMRGLAFGRKELTPQQTYFDDAADMPVFFDVDSPVLQSKLREQQEIVIIVPCQEGHELEFVQQDQFLRAFALNEDGNQIIRNVLSPMRAKGQEFSRVVIYKFGEACYQEYKVLLQLMAPDRQTVDISQEDIIPAEYFINRLYVAASRAEKRLFIADTALGLSTFWRFFECYDLELFVDRYKNTVAQPRRGADFPWSKDHLVKIQHGDQSSWERDHDNPADLAEEFYRSGRRLKDVYKLRLAAQNFEAAGKPDRKLECEGLLHELEGEFEEAGDCYVKVGNLERALQLYWKAEAFTRIVDYRQNTLECRASTIMLSPGHEPQSERMELLSDIVSAVNDGTVQPDDVWAKVSTAVFKRIVEKKPDPGLQAPEWTRLNRLVEELSSFGPSFKLDERTLDQLRLRTALYPERLEVMQRTSADPVQILQLYNANPQAQLNDAQVEIIYQACLRVQRYEEVEGLLRSYPSVKRYATLVAVYVQDKVQNRYVALVQQFFCFLCDQNHWEMALNFATNAILPIDGAHAEIVRRHSWGHMLDVCFIKALSISEALPKADIPTKNNLSKYLRTRLLENPSGFPALLTVAQAGAALERANMVVDCLEFYENVYQKKSWPATSKEQQIARERWLVCKARQTELQKEPVRKQRILREIAEKEKAWHIKPASYLPEFPVTGITDTPVIIESSRDQLRVVRKTPEAAKIVADVPAAPVLDTPAHSEKVATSPSASDGSQSSSTSFDMEITNGGGHIYRCTVKRRSGKMTIRHNDDQEMVTLSAKNLTVRGSDDEFEDEIQDREDPEDAVRSYIVPWDLTCVLRQTGQSVYADLISGDVQGYELVSLRIS